MSDKIVKCSVCGAEMKVSMEQSTGKPYRVQMCSEECMWEAYKIVINALKRGVRPEFKVKEKPKRRGRHRTLTSEERQEIVQMYIDGMTKADIARKISRTPALVGQVIKKDLKANLGRGVKNEQSKSG